jgi:hypothetical protein
VTSAGRRSRALLGGVLAGALAASGLSACNRGDGGDARRFCADVQDNIDYLRFSDFQNLDQLDTIIDLYTDIGASAPLEIQADWSALVLNLETLRDTDLDDSDAVQTMYARVYATEASAVTVVRWLDEHCGVELGPVATITPHEAVTTTSSTTTTP